jgi:hypothetical protein
MIVICEGWHWQMRRRKTMPHSQLTIASSASAASEQSDHQSSPLATRSSLATQHWLSKGDSVFSLFMALHTPFDCQWPPFRSRHQLSGLARGLAAYFSAGAGVVAGEDRCGEFRPMNPKRHSVSERWRNVF